MKFFEKLSVRMMIAIITVFFTVVPSLLVTVYMYNYTVTGIKEKYTNNYVHSTFTGIEEKFSLLFDQTTTTLLNIITYNPIYFTVIDKDLSVDKKQHIISENIGEIIGDDNLIEAVDIVLYDKTVYRYAKEGIVGLSSPDEEFVKSVRQNNFSVYSKPLYDVNKRDYLCVAIEYNNYINLADLGYIIAYIPKEKIKNRYEAFAGTNTNVFITVDDAVLFHQDEKYIGTVFYYANEFIGSESDYSYKSYQMKLIGTDNVIGVHIIAQNHHLYEIADTLGFYIIVMLIITSVLSLIFSIIVSRSLTEKLKKLSMGMRTFAQNRAEFVPVKETNELRSLEMHFNKMAEEIQKLIADNNYKNEQKRIAELNALQSQINPHFIYNAMDSIKWMSKLQRPYKEIEDAVYALAQFFRISLHKGETYIKIEEELDHVKCYLSIEKIRFADLFDAEFEIDEGILNNHTIKIILQPIVENSIKHGLKNINYKGIIKIKGYALGEFIIFEISDNGHGFEIPPSGGFPKSESEHGGYGLYNINERITMAYGEECGISIESEKEKGTKVTIKIKSEKGVKNYD